MSHDSVCSASTCRRVGVLLWQLGFMNLLALPWSLKVLWAPVVDSYTNVKFGRRKSWLLPTLTALALLLFTAAVLCDAEPLPYAFLIVTVFLMNVFAATADIATDGAYFHGGFSVYRKRQ